MGRLASVILTSLAMVTVAPRSAEADAGPRDAVELGSALVLVEAARGHEARGDQDLALRRYTEALTLDSTCAEAYLGLGSLRLRLGDPTEAWRVYSAALVHLPGLGAAHLGRARALRTQGDRAEARQSLETYAFAAGDVAALRELAGWYGDDGLPPAQLAAWRRLRALAEGQRNEALAAEAQIMVRALQAFVGPADPVSSPGRSDPRRDAFRVAVARVVRRAP